MERRKFTREFKLEAVRLRPRRLGRRQDRARTSALKVLMSHVAEVKGKAEDTVLIGCQRIGKEINGVPKAARPGRSKTFTQAGKCFSGRGSLNIPGTSRARLQKLASLPVDDLLATAKRLRETGNDATVRSVVREITQGDKKARRTAALTRSPRRSAILRCPAATRASSGRRCDYK